MSRLDKTPADYLRMEEQAEALSREPVFNHIGIACSSKEEFIALQAVMDGVFGPSEIEPAEGHDRVYYHDRQIELQFWHDPNRRTFRAHLDVICGDPMAFLHSIGANAEDWGEDEVPRGGIQLTPNVMVMARTRITKS